VISHGVGSTVACYGATVGDQFNGVKVFSATLVANRQRLGEDVTAWLAAHPKIRIDDIVVTQSSDSAFHCVALTMFYWDPGS
jgi:hypothetical protein